MEHQSTQQWQCKAHVELKNPTQEQVWSILIDFFNISKWLPGLDMSYGVEGVTGEPGCVRCCTRLNGEPDGSNKTWVKEKLVEIHHTEKSLSYEIIDNNLGYSNYRATWKVLPCLDADEKSRCLLEWSFVVDPIEGKTYEGMVTYQEGVLQAVGKTIEEAHV